MMDERRRRRLVVHQDHSTDGNAAAEVATAPRRVSAPGDAAPGWVLLPRRRWVFATLAATLFLSLAALYAAEVTAGGWPKPWSQFALSLVGDGSWRGNATLAIWWTAAACCFGIGGFRAQSPTDFGGRYRFWPAAGAMLALSVVFGQTKLLDSLTPLVAEKCPWWTWSPEQTIPRSLQTLAMLPLAWMIDRDVRTSAITTWLWRFGVTCQAALLWRPLVPVSETLSPWPWAEPILTLVAATLCGTALWWHLRFVAYENSNAPAPRAAGQLAWWQKFFQPLPPPTKLAPPSSRRRRRKVAEDAVPGEEEEAPAPRKRAVRTTKPKRVRTRKPAATEDEETSKEIDDSTSTAASHTADAAPVRDDDWETLERLTTPVAEAPARSVPDPHFKAKANVPEKVVAAVESEGWSEGESDGDDEGIDPAQLKGLRKKQRRELKRKVREQRQGESEY